MGRPKGSKNKPKTEVQAAETQNTQKPKNLVKPKEPELLDGDLENLKEYQSIEKWGNRNILCAQCNTEVPPGGKCKCPKATVELLDTKPYLTVNAPNMGKVRFFNSITQTWFKPAMTL